MKFHRSFLYRLIIFCLTLSTLPVLFLGAFSFWKSSSLIQEKVDDGSHLFLLQTQMRMEQVLKTIDHSVSQFIGSPFAYTILEQKMDITEFAAVDQLRSSLQSIQTFELGIRDILLVNMEKQWSIDSTGLIRYESRNDMLRFLPYKELPFASAWMMEPLKREDTGLHDLQLVKKLPINSLAAQGLIVATIGAKDLQKLIGQEFNFGTIAVTDDQFNVLIASDGSEQGSRLFTEEQTAHMRKSSGHFITKAGEHDVAVTYQRSSFNNWIYASIVPLSNARQDARSIGWITLITSLLILGFVVVLSFKGAKKIYFPIFTLYQSVQDHAAQEPDGSSSLVPKTDEIHFIKDRVLMLKQSNTQLLNQLHIQSRDLEYFFLINLFQGKLQEREIKNKAEQYSYNLNMNWICVCTVQIDSLENTRYKEQDRDLLLFAINNMVCELLPSDSRITSLPFDRYQVTIIGGLQAAESDFTANINEQIAQIQTMITQVLDLQVSIGISRPYTAFLHTPTAYKESLEALSYRFRLGQGAILNIADIEPAYPVKLVFPDALAQEMTEMIKGGDREKANVLLDTFVDYIINHPLSSREYQMYLVQLLIELSRLVQRKGMPFVPLYGGENLFVELFNLQTAEDIKAWFKNSIIAPIFLLLEESREEHYKQLCEEVMAMVQEHIHENITLEACAQHINYHPDYVSRVFRKHLGVNFSDYIAQLRLKLAKQLLAETELKISDISANLGYNSPQSFIRYFRKLEGITPGKYRELHREQETGKVL